MNEVWKPIAGYEGLYEVSNLGRVRKISGNAPKMIAVTDNGHGYKIVGINDGHGRKNHYVHRLVAAAFVPNPNNLPTVDHIDHNRENNNACNLRWMTQGDNVRHSASIMSKPRMKPMTNTGERYISRQKRDGRYRLTIRRHQIGTYKTINDAKAVRDAILKILQDA